MKNKKKYFLKTDSVLDKQRICMQIAHYLRLRSGCNTYFLCLRFTFNIFYNQVRFYTPPQHVFIRLNSHLDMAVSC